MGITYNTSIVRDGLVLHLDAANVKSYPGTGTTWYDLSGNGNNGTLVNTPTWTGTTFQFDGISSYIEVLSPNLSTGAFTVFGSSRYAGSIRARMINARYNNWLMGHWGAHTENYYASSWVTSSTAGTNDTLWRVYAATGTTVTDTWQLYVNSTKTIENANGTSGPNGFTIGRAGTSGLEWSNGECGFLLAYSRVLSAAEVKQNFNATRKRYGL